MGAFQDAAMHHEPLGSTDGSIIQITGLAASPISLESGLLVGVRQAWANRYSGQEQDI